MQVSKNSVLAFGIATLVGACGAPESGSEHIGVLLEPARCGPTWDLQDVELYDGSDATFDQAFVAKYQGATGRLCSGTLIGPDLFLTVNHCGPEPGQSVGFNCQLSASNPNPPDLDAAAAGNCVWFEATETWTYGGSIDTRLSRLEGSPGLTYGWVLPSLRVPAASEQLAIIQHPLAFGRRKMVGFGPFSTLDGKDLRYVIDTSGGSSGSGVLDARGLLVGVHRASGCTDTGGSNTATSMQYVFDNVPEVRWQIAAAWQGVLG
jgi:hypothetical protein